MLRWHWCCALKLSGNILYIYILLITEVSITDCDKKIRSVQWYLIAKKEFLTAVSR